MQNTIEQLNNAIEDAKNAIIEALNDRATTKSQLSRYDTMLEQVQIRKAELTSRLVRVKSDEAAADQVILELEQQFQEVNEKISDLNHKQADMELRLSEIRDQLTEKDKILQETREKFHQEKSKLDALSNLTERYEGYGGSVKLVMEQ